MVKKAAARSEYDVYRALGEGPESTILRLFTDRRSYDERRLEARDVDQDRRSGVDQRTEQEFRFILESGARGFLTGGALLSGVAFRSGVTHRELQRLFAKFEGQVDNLEPEVRKLITRFSNLIDDFKPKKPGDGKPTPPDKQGAEQMRDVLGANPREIPEKGPGRNALQDWNSRATAPKKIDALAGTSSQKEDTGSNVPRAPGVLVTDINGIALNGVTVTFTVEAGGGSMVDPITLERLTRVQVVTGPGGVPGAAAGTATVRSWRLGDKPGSNLVTATVARAGISTDFKATGK